MIIDYDYLASEFAKCYKDKSRIYMIQNYLKTFDNTRKKDVPFQLFPRQQVTTDVRINDVFPFHPSFLFTGTSQCQSVLICLGRFSSSASRYTSAFQPHGSRLVENLWCWLISDIYGKFIAMVYKFIWPPTGYSISFAIHTLKG